MQIILKSVSKHDWDFIYDLRTNPVYKKNFYSNIFFTPEEHYSYLSKQEENPHFFHWIISNNIQNIGYVRILDNDVSIMISPEFQSKGVGTQALTLVENQAKKLGISKLIGRIMVENESSKKIFENNGYKLKMFWLEKDI